MSLDAAFGAPAASVTFVCTVSTAAHTYSSLPIALEVQPTLWPLFQDAVVSQAGGLIKSAWGSAINATARVNALLANTSTTDGDSRLLQQDCSDVLSSDCNTGPSSFEALLEVVDAYAAEVPVAAAASGSSFSILLSDETTIVLVADKTFWSRSSSSASYSGFTNATQVWIGDTECSVEWVSDDGRLLAFTAPAIDTVCPAAATGGDCGYAALNVANPVTTALLASRTSTQLSCPPFCPGLFTGMVPFPAVTAASTGQSAQYSFVPALQQSNALPAPVQSSAVQFSAAGLYYTSSCIAEGYTDPTDGACLNTTSPGFGRCAFGIGSNCKPCPYGAICPGGNRAWPMPGFYTASESSGVVVACDPPATERCRGWNASIGGTGCGAGYRPGSYACLACDAAFYTDVGGSCASCPSVKGLWPVLQPVLIFAGAVLAVAAALYGGLLLIVRKFGGSLSGGLKRMFQFVTWSVTVMQV